MLTPTEIKNTRKELQENYRRLGYDLAKVSRETELSESAVQAVLEMANPNCLASP